MEVGVWRGRSGQGVFPLPRPGWRPPNYCDCFFFFLFFLISLIYCFYRGKMHNCAHPTVLGTRVLGWNVSHVDQNLQLQSFPLSPS